MKKYLLTPGPTPIPENANLAMMKPIIHHRTPEFANIFEEVIEGLKYIFQTKNDIIVFAATGTGGMQASISNFLSSSDKILVIEGGKFGQRFSKIGKSYGLDVIPIEVEWGKAVDPEIIRQKLDSNEDIKAVYTTLCETSTGVLTDIKTIAEIVSATDAILVVDAVSALGVCELKTDEWNVDVVISGSQKGLMTPPGLSFISVSEKAWAKTEDSNLPEFYFSAMQGKDKLSSFNTPWTPAVTLLQGLNAVIKDIKKQGLENLLNKYAKLAKATRSAVESLEMEIFASQPANAVTAIKAPQGIDSQEVVKYMRDELGVIISGGQAQLKGKIMRIAHMGYMEEFDMIVAISALEVALKKLGYDLELGKGVAVAQNILFE